MTASTPLEQYSLRFAAEVQGTLDAVLASVGVFVSEHAARDDRFLVHPDGEGSARWIPLAIDGCRVADLDVIFYLTLDHAGEFLKAIRSDLKVYLAADGVPLVRLEYRSDMRSAPVAHWHIHAARDRFDPVLEAASAAGRGSTKRQRDLSAMHLPVGGERYRPCLEDLLEYLIRELGIDALPRWEQAVSRGRENWRLRQLRSVVRDNPEQAAQVLKSLDWSVSRPVVGLPDSHEQPERW